MKKEMTTLEAIELLEKFYRYEISYEVVSKFKSKCVLCELHQSPNGCPTCPWKTIEKQSCSYWASQNMRYYFSWADLKIHHKKELAKKRLPMLAEWKRKLLNTSE